MTEIQVRRISFTWPEVVRAHWHPARPEWSQMANAGSLLMPYLEPYLIAGIRDALPRIADPRLAEDARAYMGQEAQHYQQHRRFNERLLAPGGGYERLREWEALVEADYARLREARSLDFHLAYAAGFETMALALGHVLVRGRAHYFRGADPEVASLVLWHFVEELEHKRVAFEVYQHVVGRWTTRVHGLLYAVTHTLARTRRAYRLLLEADGRWGRWRTRWALKREIARLFVAGLPWLLESLSPWHDPGRFADPEWARDWLASWDAGTRSLLRLDTARIERLPSEIAAA